MRYAVRFYHNDVINKADEVIITINRDFKPTELINFINKHKEQRVIADVANNLVDKNIEVFKRASALSKSFTLRISCACNSLALLNEENIKYFFREYVDTLDKLDTFVQLGVSDVYIVNELGFNIKNISKLCKSKNISIRTFPNIAQNSISIIETNNFTLKSFFISPADIDLYSEYIDVCEFWGELKKQSTLYDIYQKKVWKDDLSLLILGLKESINGNMIPPGWAEKRLSCEKKCVFCKCTMCDTVKSIANFMHENGYQFDKEKTNG